MSSSRDHLNEQRFDEQRKRRWLSASETGTSAERMLSLMLNNIPQGVFWKDRDSRYLGCNQVVASAFGLESTEDIVGLSDFQLQGLTREQADTFVAYDRQVIETDKPHLAVVEQATLADGTTVWIETDKFPTHDSTGAVNGIFGTCKDITAKVLAETRLREREGQLTTFIEHAPVSLAMFDREMRYMHVSQRWKLDLQLGECDVRGLALYDVVPNIPERWKAVHRRALAGEIVRADEDRFDLTDGTTLWLRWEVRPWFEDSGSVGGILIFAEEITQRKRGNEDRALLSAIVESSENAIISVSLDGTILSWNAGAEKLFGYTSTEAIGQPVNLIIPPDRQQEETERLRLLTHSERATNFETTRRTKSGLVLDISLALSPIRNGYGEVVGASSILRDITLQKQNENALKQREVLLRSATDNAAVGLAMLDLDRRYIFVNASYPRILNLPWRADELVGRGPAEILAEVYTSQIEPHLDVAFSGQRVTYELARPRTSTNREVTAHYVVVYDPMFDNSGVVEGVIVTIFDITERKKSEAERQKLESHLRHSQKLESLGVLAGGIAHDFNNVLTSILGYADLALLELPAYSSARPLIAEAVNGARKASELTRQMLAYSGKGKFVVEALNLNQVIEDMVHLLQVSISKKCVLKLHLMPSLPSIEADAVQMRQVIMNLIINASDAIGEQSGVIAITTGVMLCDREYLSESYLDENLVEGPYVYFEVADTGCGMHEETKMRIFDPFFTTKTTGRGLGLAAALGIVRGHKGVLKVYSEVSKGTTFKVAFPATDSSAQAGPADRSPDANWQGIGTVLLVDDEDSVRGLVQCMLEKMGFTVLTAKDGRESVDVFRHASEVIRLVLLDMTMPHMDGAETFRELRRIRSDIKTILTSGYNEQSAISQFAGKGLAGFIQKPFRFEDLQALVRKVFAAQ